MTNQAYTGTCSLHVFKSKAAVFLKYSHANDFLQQNETACYH